MKETKLYCKSLDIFRIFLFVQQWEFAGVKVHCFVSQKYRNLSVLLTEQINLYLRMEEKPEKVSYRKNAQIKTKPSRNVVLASCLQLKFCSVTVILKQFKCAYSIVVLYRVQLSYRSRTVYLIVPTAIRVRTCGLTKWFHDISWYNSSVGKFQRYLLHISRVVNISTLLKWPSSQIR